MGGGPPWPAFLIIRTRSLWSCSQGNRRLPTAGEAFEVTFPESDAIGDMTQQGPSLSPSRRSPRVVVGVESGTFPMAGGELAAGEWPCSCPDTRTSPAEKAGTVMHETDPSDRFEAALRLSEEDPIRGADALDRIVVSNENDPDERFEAALRLSEVDPVRAAARLRNIVVGDEFDRDTRDEAAHRLSELEG